MPHSYMGVGYVECICYISIDISKNWPMSWINKQRFIASMVGWAPPRIVFPSGSCLPFSKCSAASYWIHVEAKLEADPKLNPWYFMILRSYKNHKHIFIYIFISTQLRFPQFWPRCTWRHCVSDSRCCCVQCSLAASGVMRRMEFCFILAKVHELPSSCVLGLSCGSTSLRFFRDALKGLVLNWSLNWSRIGHELVIVASSKFPNWTDYPSGLPSGNCQCDFHCWRVLAGQLVSHLAITCAPPQNQENFFVFGAHVEALHSLLDWATGQVLRAIPWENNGE